MLVGLSFGTILVSNQAFKQQNLSSNAQAVTNCDVAAEQLAMTASEEQLLSLINAYRQQSGAPALISSPQLKRAAEWLSIHMATGGPFSHTDGMGRNFSTRLKDCGFSGGTSAENIALNSSKDSAAQTFDQWKNSPGHNTNMLNAKYTQIGIAEAISADGKHYWSYDAAAGTPNGTVPTAKPAPPTAVPTPTQAPLPTQPPLPTSAPQPTTAPLPTQQADPTIPENPTPTFSCLGGCPISPTDISQLPGESDPTNGSEPTTQAPLPPVSQTEGETTGSQPHLPADQGLLVLILLLIIQLLRGVFGGF